MELESARARVACLGWLWEGEREGEVLSDGSGWSRLEKVLVRLRRLPLRKRLEPTERMEARLSMGAGLGEAGGVAETCEWMLLRREVEVGGGSSYLKEGDQPSLKATQMLLMVIIERSWSVVWRISCLEGLSSESSSRMVGCCLGVAVGVDVERSGIL